MNKQAIIDKLEARKTRSAWDKGVILYAVEALEYIEVDEVTSIDDVLNGAQDARQYSEGGCALIYDTDIAERLCAPSELKRKRGGELAPNSRESWLDVQTRALRQAFDIVKRIIYTNAVKG